MTGSALLQSGKKTNQPNKTPKPEQLTFDYYINSKPFFFFLFGLVSKNPSEIKTKNKQTNEDFFSTYAIRGSHRKCLKKTLNMRNLQVMSISGIPKCNNVDKHLGRPRLCQKLGCCEIVLAECEEDGHGKCFK